MIMNETRDIAQAMKKSIGDINRSIRKDGRRTMRFLWTVLRNWYGAGKLSMKTVLLAKGK